MSSFYVLLYPDVDRPSVEAWSAERLPFEPKGWKLQFRNDLREALRRLSFVSGSNLVALYISPVEEYCDAENIMFYNVGAASFARLKCKSIRFERVFSQPPTTPMSRHIGWKHYLSYVLSKRAQGFTYWEPTRLLAKWEQLPCGKITSSSKVESVWHRFKLGIGAGRVQRLVASEAIASNLGLEVTIHVPRGTRLNLTSVIKPVFDGIVAAFSRDEGGMDLATERLAAALGIDQEELTGLLEDETMAVLGSRRLVHPRGRGVQWNPNDDLLVAGEFSFADDAPEGEWRLSGKLLEARKAGSRDHLP